MVKLNTPGSLEFLSNTTGIGKKSVELMHRQSLLSSIFVTREREREKTSN